MQETLVPSRWETERTRVSDARREDAPTLTALVNACAYVQPWDPTFYRVEESELLELIERSIATDDAAEERFRLQIIHLRDGGAAIGYYHCIHGKPDPDDVWISIFLLHPDYQHHRYGDEVVAELAALLSGRGYRAMKLDVSLKNWPALRFWTRVGFTEIVGIKGDALYSETTHAKIRLRKEI